ncbi:hypothetical protein GCM10022226_46960 [Sphaerisporangium flaviroseum]|uniref:Uncharacterized protein n=1 Tax=Sphaerisporangium flaviroseum TaxID=509199 RepID=A0ABP7ILI1_9ACTN
MTGLDGPSAWAQERFGDAAGILRREIPAALWDAHRRALDGHLALGLKTNEAYGLIWLAQHEELVARLRGLDGARVFKPKGARYELAMIGNVVLYPWRYSDGTRVPLEYARMELSDVRRALLALAEPPDEEQLTLDSFYAADDDLEADEEQSREDFRQLAEVVRVVFVAYASNPRSGILSAEWGDAAQADDDGHLKWTHHEPLPMAALGESGGEAGTGQPTPLRPVAPTGGSSSSARRFDDAPVPEPVLMPKSPLTGVDSEQQETTTETGTDEEH